MYRLFLYRVTQSIATSFKKYEWKYIFNVEIYGKFIFSNIQMLRAVRINKEYFNLLQKAELKRLGVFLAPISSRKRKKYFKDKFTNEYFE